MSRRSTLRKLTQLGTVGLLVAMPLAALAGVDFLRGSLCAVGTDSVFVACPVGTTQILLASRTFDLGLIAAASVPVFLAIVLGRVFCGWSCPQGLLSELGDQLRTRLRPSARRAPDSRRRWRRGRALLLTVLIGGLLSSLVFGVPVLCYICPVGLICRSLVSGTVAGTIGGELVILAVILTAEVFLARRGWCKYICPIGAIYGLCSTPFTLTIRHTREHCVSCQTCSRECPMGCAPLSGQVLSSCINCGVCIDDCPEGALDFGFGARKG